MSLAALCWAIMCIPLATDQKVPVSQVKPANLTSACTHVWDILLASGLGEMMCICAIGNVNVRKAGPAWSTARALVEDRNRVQRHTCQV